jgi:hypothetical protein
MRAHEHGGEGFHAGADAEDVAHLVHADRQPGLLHPAHEEIAPEAVLVAEGQPGEAAARRLADAPQGVHARGSRARSILMPALLAAALLLLLHDRLLLVDVRRKRLRAVKHWTSPS